MPYCHPTSTVKAVKINYLAIGILFLLFVLCISIFAGLYLHCITFSVTYLVAKIFWYVVLRFVVFFSLICTTSLIIWFRNARNHRRTSQFFLRELSHLSLCRKIFWERAKKTAMLTCIVALPDSPRPIIVNKNSGFWALHFAGRNKFRFVSFNKYFFSGHT